MKIGKKDALKTVAFGLILVALIVSILVAGGKEPADRTSAEPLPDYLSAEAAAEADVDAPYLEPAGEPAPPAETAAPKPRTATASSPRPRAAAPSSLPPLGSALQGSAGSAEVSLGPPPGVLWLSGIIKGDPTLAILRRDANRYLVREGETIEGAYRVIEISSASVTLQRGSRKQVLRVGQY